MPTWHAVVDLLYSDETKRGRIPLSKNIKLAHRDEVREALAKVEQLEAHKRKARETTLMTCHVQKVHDRRQDGVKPATSTQEGQEGRIQRTMTCSKSVQSFRHSSPSFHHLVRGTGKPTKPLSSKSSILCLSPTGRSTIPVQRTGTITDNQLHGLHLPFSLTPLPFSPREQQPAIKPSYVGCGMCPKYSSNHRRLGGD